MTSPEPALLQDARPGDHRAARFYRSWGWAPDGAAKTGHTPLGDLDEVRHRIDL